MLTREPERSPAIELPLPLPGIETQAAWVFDTRTHDLEAGYQRARAAFNADLERDTLADRIEVDAQLTIEARLERPPGSKRGPARRPLPTPAELLASLPRAATRRGPCRWRGKDVQGAPELGDVELARDVLYALRHGARARGGSEWDYSRIHEFTLARAATHDWFTCAAFMHGATPGCPLALQERVGNSRVLRDLLGYVIHADRLGKWGCFQSGKEWAGLLRCNRQYVYTLIGQLERAGYLVVIGTHRPKAHHEGGAPSETDVNWIGVGPELAKWRDLWAQTGLDEAAAQERVRLTRETVRRHRWKQEPRRKIQFPTRREYRDELQIAAAATAHVRDLDDMEGIQAHAVATRDLSTLIDDLEANRTRVAAAAAAANLDVRAVFSPLVEAASAPVPDSYLDAVDDLDDDLDAPCEVATADVEAAPPEPVEAPTRYKGRPRRRRKRPDLSAPKKSFSGAVLHGKNPFLCVIHAPTIENLDTDSSGAGYETPYPLRGTQGAGPAGPERRPPRPASPPAGPDPNNAGPSSRRDDVADPRLEGCEAGSAPSRAAPSTSTTRPGPPSSPSSAPALATRVSSAAIERGAQALDEHGLRFLAAFAPDLRDRLLAIAGGVAPGDFTE